MMQVGLAHAGEGITLEAWQPPGRATVVINEDYMNSAVAEYKRLPPFEEGTMKRAKKGATKRVIAAIVGILALTAFALATYVEHAQARPGRVSAVEVSVNVS
jgi:hypothetical protein